MIVVEILVAVSAISFVLFLIGSYLYKIKKGTYKGECENCNKRMNKNLDKIKKELNKEFC